ncbi:hypothetical protein AMECASPLE_020935 [Ameca splendens]|uniref:Uncharacterized protein n=1 Tax=Ameca splendens TaxID=208324 RepID=A0ABV0YQB3_9TELE
MPSCSVSLGLLALMGGMLACAWPVQARNIFVSDNLKEIHTSIATKLDLMQLEVNQEPLFDFVLRIINTSCQRKDDIQLLNATLNIYMRIFSNVLHPSLGNHHGGSHNPRLLDSLTNPADRSKVHSALKQLKKKIEELKSRLTCQNQNIETALSELDNIKVDDPMVQKKALAEFLRIYQAASTVAAVNAGSAK